MVDLEGGFAAETEVALLGLALKVSALSSVVDVADLAGQT